jgi:hypothetical protein
MKDLACHDGSWDFIPRANGRGVDEFSVKEDPHPKPRGRINKIKGEGREMG